ncbi:hypothetical protein F511_21202 [Dorcoceras hygrometricum]|uniref:Splicing factor 3B subunit 1-like n=1 Tax=Dorcoceras hygrometricum TaxID=472368 RepID=A0A2Z7B7Q3_9LAMI|nr:hypothetical protein F511_21202 [Dorcoceras hygrometricum]
MASSLINNASQIYFDSVYGMDYEGMVQMFKSLESSGLRGFLGCSSAIYEAALVEFFQNSSVRDGKVVSTVQGKAVEITEEVFAGTFELLTEGLTEMPDVPKDLVFDARRAFSMGGEQLKTSCKKREMKYEFRLLNDILDKTVTVKAGSFDAVTHERFLMMSAIHGGVKVNRGRLLFNIFKDMVTSASNQSRGTLNIVVEEVVDEPVVKKATPKRRPAPAVGELISKKKRTTVGRASPAETYLMMVPVVQDTEPIFVVPAVTPKAQRRRAPKRKLVLQKGSDDEIFDSIIHQVIVDTAAIETGEPDLGEPDLEEPTTETVAIETESRIDVPAITNYDEDSSLKVLSNEKRPLVETKREEENEKEIVLVTIERMSLEKITDSEDIEPLSKVLALTEKSKLDEESMSIDDLLALRRLVVMESIKDIVAKEEQMLAWAETDSLETAVKRRIITWSGRARLTQGCLKEQKEIVEQLLPDPTLTSYLLAWIRRLLKFDGSWKIVEDCCRWIPMYRKTIYSEKQQPSVADHASICFFFQPVQVVRTLPIIKTWGWARVCTDMIQFHLFGHLEPVGTRNLCTDIVPVKPVVDRSGVPKRAVNNVQYDIRIVDSLSVLSPDPVAEEPVVPIETDPTDSPFHFTADDILLGDETTTAALSIDFTSEFAKLRASVDQISIEHVQTRVHIEKLKATIFTKISSLESAFLARSETQDRAVLVNNNVILKEIKAQKAALSQEMDIFRK